MTRLDRIREKMQENSWDSLILTSPANRYYVSGFSGSAGIVLITADNQYVLVDGRYTLQAKKETKGFEIVECKSNFIKGLNSFPINRLGFEADTLSFNDYKLMKETLPDSLFHDCSRMLQGLRMIKDQAEIERIRGSIALADHAFNHICSFIKEGVTEHELAIELEFFMRSQGASALSFETIAASGIRGAMPHGAPTDKKLEKGDFVVMDYGCILDGYCSDITRTIVIGEASEQQRMLYNTILKAQNEAICAVKDGVPASDVDEIARNVMGEYEKYFTHALGHGLGIEVHEEPRLSKISNTILEENMVVTIEPGIYISDLGGIRIEDLVVVTKEGCENLTKSIKELMIV